MAGVRWVWCLAAAGALAVAANAAASATATGAVEGRWGGEQVHLRIDSSGGRIEAGCASGTLTPPHWLGVQGSFQASGTFDLHRPRPQRADDPKTQAGAQYAAEVKDGVMRLSITLEDGRTAQQFELRKGQGGKLVRCL